MAGGGTLSGASLLPLLRRLAARAPPAAAASGLLGAPWQRGATGATATAATAAAGWPAAAGARISLWHQVGRALSIAPGGQQEEGSRSADGATDTAATTAAETSSSAATVHSSSSSSGSPGGAGENGASSSSGGSSSSSGGSSSGSGASAAASAPPKPQQPPTFPELLESERQLLKGGGPRMPQQAHAHMGASLKRFQANSRVRDRALSAFVHAELFPRAAAAFRKFMLRAATEPLGAALLQHGSHSQEVEDLLFGYFVAFCRHSYGAQLAAYEKAVAALDLRAPHSWYPYARAIHRKIIYHAGPTNSGKTYQALQALAAAKRGVYAGPLRLLAMEVYEQLNADGVRCDMVTGQEVLRVPGAGHSACTVEMVPLQTHADVAVVDEIQMIGDPQRGFAWTRALLGLPANEIHVCGDPSAVTLVKQLADECGDEFELRTYDRLTPLAIDEACLPNGWADVQPGDCIVAFSRKQLYHIRKEVEAATGLRTCIVYGALPAETRRAQARLFNDPDSGHNVLIASDAIGMGLNFNIRRVVFSTMVKSLGASATAAAKGQSGGQSGSGQSGGQSGGNKQRGPVPVSLVKQIAGRAGRRSSAYPQGYATTLDPADLKRLKEAVALPPEDLQTPAAGLAPEFETIEMLAGQMQNLSVEQLLKKFESEARLDGTYFFCNQEAPMQIAKLIKEVPNLSLQDRFTFCMAPVSINDEIVTGALREFTHWYALGSPVILDPSRMPKRPPSTDEELAHMESIHRVLSLWMWLSLRFDESCFPGRDKVARMMQQLCAWMSAGLKMQVARGGSVRGDAEAAAAKAEIAGVVEEVRAEAVAAAMAEGGGGDESSSSISSSERGTEAATARGAAAGGGAAAAGGASSSAAARAAALAVERLLEDPEYHPSMSRFVRFTTAHRLVVPPPPAAAAEEEGDVHAGTAS